MTSRRVREAAMHYPKKTAAPVQQVPMSLTGSDGTGLKLVALQGKAVVQGPLAFTELHLSFRNQESRRREGRFSITLPPGAAISRFAMKVHGAWQEAEVVERQRARQIYEDFLHRKQDPALLEKKAGNQFRARIFPIEANSIKEIIVSYSQKLASSKTPYRLFLKGLPKIERLNLSAFVGEQVESQQGASSLGGVSVTNKVVRVEKTDWAPEQDFIVPTQSTIGGLRHSNLALMRVAPKISAQRAAAQSLLLLVDTSGSRAAGFYRQVEQVGAVVKHLSQTYGAKLPLHVACFDQGVGSVFEGTIGEFGQRDLDQILARRPLGASDLHSALQWAGKLGRFSRVLLVTDGIATAGKTDGAELRQAVKQLSGKVQRMDVMLVGGIRNEAGMKVLVQGTLSRDGVVLDGELPAAAIAKRLSQQTLSGIRVMVPGAKWVWPSRLDGAQPGDEVLVFADLPAGALAQGRPMTVSLSGPISGQHSAKLASVNRPLLERAWVGARIARLKHQGESGDLDPDLKGAVRKQIIDLSIKYRVLSDYTALLVLETEADYRRYGIQRTSLADIMVVGAGGLEVQNRTKPQPVVQPPPRPRPWRRPVMKRPPRRQPSASPPRSRPRSKPRPSRPTEVPQDMDGKEEASGGEGMPSAEPPRAAAAKSTMAPATPAPPPRPSPAKRLARRSMDFEDDSAESGQSLAEAPRRSREARPEPARQEKKKDQGPPALTGKVAQVARLIQEGKVEQALVDALRWRAEKPGDVMALVALGMALEAHGNFSLAARVYGSIIDLFPSRADMRRFAGNRLEALGMAGIQLAVDTYGQAAKQRADHPASHRLYAFALMQVGRHEEALAVLEKGIKTRYRIQRRGALRILREDLGLAAAALAAKEPNRRADLMRRLSQYGARIADKPSLRFVLTWETDANDVDFHIHDGQGGHAYYSSPNLPSGGVLFADVTNGYGPECFAIPGKAAAFPYSLQAHYYSRGPMGYGMGQIQVVQHDGKGGLLFSARPFVAMNDRAYVDLGVVKGPLEH